MECEVLKVQKSNLEISQQCREQVHVQRFTPLHMG